MICVKTNAMKRYILFILFTLPFFYASAQKKTDADELSGEYKAGLPIPLIFRIRHDNDKLMLQIVGQGTIELTPLGEYNFRPKFVTPSANLQFFKDSTGKITKFRWTQKSVASKWVRISAGEKAPGGSYQLKDNPYRVLHITEHHGQLKGSMFGEPETALSPIGNGRFRFKQHNLAFSISFSKDSKELTAFDEAPIDFVKVSSGLPHRFGREYGFTRADSLQGMLTPLRTCYDVLFYDLDIVVTPENKSIRGNTAIRFRTIRTFDRMQIDLFANMKIEKILFHGQELAYTRQYNAVFVQFPVPVTTGSEDEIHVVYSGQPQEPDIDAEKGGWLWLWNRDHKMWIGTVSQGIGSSVWWPCKDHLSDRPDSMKISVTYPTGLTEISNGRLLARTALPGSLERCVWYVGYPINNYNVVINIGDYTRFSDTCIDGHDTLGLSYYCMSYNREIAKNIFSRVKPMLALYKKTFGPYPFQHDGFTLMESVYPMEHQGAVSIGPINSPFNSFSYDSAELVRLMWHESAHEWWGNNVGCRDYADFWIHESFATYAVVLNYESVSGREAALKYLHSDPPQNKEPIIGVYDVNHFHMGDMYPKGALMLHTLRNVINNDSLWFTVFRGIQEHFRYSPITTEDIVGYFNTATGKDYTWFFDQYLRYPSIPVLLLEFKEEGSSLKIRYKWQADRAGFCLPVKWTTSKDKFEFAYPRTDWQEITLKEVSRKDFKVDTDNFYIAMKEVTLSP